MAAPALVALAHASRDSRTTKAVAALVDEVRSQRPDLRVERAFLDADSPAGSTARWVRPEFQAVVDRLVKAGHDEVVVVPLVLSDGSGSEVPGVADAVHAATARHPGLQVRVSADLGLEACFLEVLDERLREALRSSRIRELDALVLAAAGSTDPLANQSVARLARLWGTHHRLPVTAAYAGSAPPATGEAVRAFRAEGRRHIAVASLFLTPGVLTDRACELAVEAGAVAVSAPLGAHPEIARVVLARYAVGAVELVPV
ncbi:sirohydrochlorin chelatase [Nocardioides dongxiaopingii]|uniref:sirohydrochlorin chelatase n=1 Tax=Nocardioides TaxID=1839 RepID=UPI0010C768EF|nr:MULTISPECIES: CbiX/SirB N-terminal domain-containing protein [Nocardioides]QCW51055.1 sirohydrochlorin chelatase [Nocardioides sp. S-1144]